MCLCVCIFRCVCVSVKCFDVLLPFHLENWRWPLKYVSKYGCDFDVFSFEAGRKCLRGGGLYALSVR